MVPNIKIQTLNAFQDNYIFLIINEDSKEAVVVDPGDSGAVFSYLEQNDLVLKSIYLTHHHADHIDGVADLSRRYSCEVLGFEGDVYRLPPLTTSLKDNETFSLWGNSVVVRHTPGHTLGHIIYYFLDLNACFVGDTLFSMGCGRLFEGTAQQMFQSLELIKGLPLETKIYCAHEYTLHNIAFAKGIITEGNIRDDLLFYEARMKVLREKNIPTIPFSLREQIALNPFLAVSLEGYRSACGLESLNALEAFMELRRRRDQF